MQPMSRRNVLAVAAAGSVATATRTASAQTFGNPDQPPQGAINTTGNPASATDPGPQNPALASQFPDAFSPPPTDVGDMPMFWASFNNAPRRIQNGGWARQVTQADFAIAEEISGVDMRLNTGGVRELHWHKAAEWAYMLYGRARITAVDQDGRNFADDVGVGDLWYFPSGIPHSIQGLEPDGCEFLLVFDDGSFSEDNTFLISDWFKHVPPDVLAKNFGVPASSFASTPDTSELYIFPLPVPGPLASDRIPGASPVPQSFSHRLMAQDPIRTKSGTVRIADSKNFPASITIAAALVEILPGGLRELHWHPNTDEWQYYIEGQGRMGVFASAGDARTFDYQAGDVGFVPFAMGHYIENTGSTPLRFLEMFKSSYYADVSLNRWMALTPPELVQGTLKLDATVMSALRKGPAPVVPV